VYGILELTELAAIPTIKLPVFIADAHVKDVIVPGIDCTLKVVVSPTQILLSVLVTLNGVPTCPKIGKANRIRQRFVRKNIFFIVLN
jgi:hypothetical protein